MTELEKLQTDLLDLPIESRASLARALIESLDEVIDEEAEASWVAEISFPRVWTRFETDPFPTAYSSIDIAVA
jgi:hypothetical protein